MANWVIERLESGEAAVYHDNLHTGRRWNCGTVEADIPDEAILEWLYEYARPAYGDRIVLSDGRSFYFQAAPAAASA